MIKNVDLLEGFGIMNASSMKFYDIDTNALDLFLKKSNKVTIEVKSSSKTAKVQGRDTIYWNLPKEGTLKAELEVTTFAILAKQLGSLGLKVNETIEDYDKEQIFTITDLANMVFTLTDNTKNLVTTNVSLLTRDGEIAKALTCTIDATDKKKVTVVTDADLEVGDKISICYKTEVQPNGMYKISIPARSNTKVNRMTANILGKGQKSGEKILMQLEVPQIQISDGCTISCDSENPSKFDVEFKILAGATIDEEEEPEFFNMKILKPNATVVVTPITDLNATSTLATKADLTFTASTSATNVELQYKLSTDSTYTSVTVGGSTGIRIATALDGTSTGTTVLGLTSSSSYNFKLLVTGGTHAGTSNVATVTVA